MRQLEKLHAKFDLLQNKWGDSKLKSIYGAGQTSNPKVMFIFMNPTGRNISSSLEWKGLRAPWLGTKQVWSIFNDVGLLKDSIFLKIMSLKPNEWNLDFANDVYKDIGNHSVYITNLAKCTQIDARPLKNVIFNDYLELMYEEIEIVQPRIIISFGNQVSSILIKRQISVSNYLKIEAEILEIRNTFNVYPTFYPVGQGRRNMPLAIDRIRKVIHPLY